MKPEVTSENGFNDDKTRAHEEVLNQGGSILLSVVLVGTYRKSADPEEHST